MKEKILTNIRIIDPSQKMNEIGDIIINDKGKIKSIGKGTKNSDITKFGTRLDIKSLRHELLREFHPGNGLLFELEIDCLNDLSDHLQPKDQTISYFGLSKEEILSFLRIIDSRAIDRFLPIGESLNFSPIWDGYDLYRSFTRQILIK